MIDYIILILVSLFCWIESFLLHEYMHIKSQGILMTGTIDVKQFGFTCSPEFIKNRKWLYYAGGILSGIVYLIMGVCLWYYGIWSFYVPFITFGIINLSYGIWEGWKGPTGRYKVYIATIGVMVVFWLLYFMVI